MKFSPLIPAALTISGAVALALLSSCTPYQQQGAAVGGLGGAALGAIAGNDGGDVLRGAAIGAAAGTGVAAYRENQQNRNNNFNNTRQSSGTYQPSEPPQTTYTPPATSSPPPQRTSQGNYPVALQGVSPNTVISPFPPYNPLDVTGYKSGQKVCDPSTIPINPATGEQYIDPATGEPDVRRGKYFLVP